MQQNVGVESGVGTRPVLTWAQVNGKQREPLEWQSVDRALRTLHARRCGLDAEEARWLRLADELQIWRPLGMVSAIDYMERVLGYAPRTARERLRVARALGQLPTLDDALAHGELPYSAARELTRVATPDNEAEWIAAARDKNLREIEGMVADRNPGDRPTEPRDPTARVHVVRLELSAETFALLRQARQVLDDEHGTSLTEDQLIAAMCQTVLDGKTPAEASGRAKFQIAVTVCERCQQGWQHGAGAKVPISAAAVERAQCDAQHIGSIDDDAPARAYQDVAPSVARLVWHRDAGRCRVPGCRSARGLEVHHIVHRADGGGHDVSNLALLCSSCHQAHHAGTIAISGTADQLEVRRPACPMEAASSGTHVGPVVVRSDDSVARSDTGVQRSNDAVRRSDDGVQRSHDSARRSDDSVRGTDDRGAACAPAPRGSAAAWEAARLREDAKRALMQTGWKSAVARGAVDEAWSAGAVATLEQLVFEALRRCPRA